MRARPQIEPLVAALAFAVAIAAGAWWMLSDETVVQSGAPTYQGAPVEIVTASLPAIGDFDREYNVNDENPFVPLLQRVAEARKIRQNRTAKPTPTSKPPQVEEVPIPQLHFPAAKARRADAPDCVGVIGSLQGETLLVRTPGSGDTVSIVVGDAVPKDAPADQQWVLVALEAGGVARFRDPSGSEQLFMIGTLPTNIVPPHAEGAAAQAQIQAPGPQPVAPQPRPQQPRVAPQPPFNRPNLPGHVAPSDRPRGWTPRPPSEAPPMPPMPPVQPAR